MKITSQRLSRYIRDYKYTQHQCSGCGVELSRVRLLYCGKLISHKEILSMDHAVSPEEWQQFLANLVPVCRFCSTVTTGCQGKHFDIEGFKLSLLASQEVCLATVREYVMRLRRLDQMLSVRDIALSESNDSLSENDWQVLFPGKNCVNYQIALAKYFSYYPRQTPDAVTS